jgi:carbon starvation protein
MNSLVILVLGVLVAFLGYLIYARRIDKSVIKSDPNKATPARMYMDGVDFTPTSRNVLFGYQFKSIAALGPIIGAIIAAQWGWLPALLWLFLGTLFIGWVHDYSSAMVSMRNEGQSFGGLSYQLVSPRARSILLIFIYCYLLLIMGAFGSIVAGQMSNPQTPFGVIVMCLAGILAGQMIYKWRRDIILTSVVTVIISFGGIYLATLPFMAKIFTVINGGEVSRKLFGSVTQAQFIWTIVIMFLCYLGAVMPIWRFAQPVNFVAFWIVALGIIGTALGIIIWHPNFEDFPALTTWSIGIGPLWPILFVTVACGAISGWHSLVSSSGTSRQLEKETDALPVTGGAMFAEMILAVIALIIAAAAHHSFANYKAALSKGWGNVFSSGMGTFLSKIGIPMSFGTAYAGVFLCVMALTVMWLILRFMRIASAEFIGDRAPIMRNVHVGSIVAVILSVILIWTGYWQRIWVLFGGSNQLMASLALMLITIWLVKIKKSSAWTSIPAIFMYITTIAALIYTSYKAFKDVGGAELNIAIGNIIAGILAIVLIIAAFILAYDGVRAFLRHQSEKAAQEKATGSAAD